LASHPEQRAVAETEIAVDDDLRYVEACLEEAMRLWPTTALLGRETIADSELAGATIPAGTQVLISNTFNHRDRETHAFADRFAPEAWTTGDARDDWTLNHFSRGRQCCPGAGLARVLGAQVLATALSRPELRLIAPRLDPARPLPAMLDFFRLRFALR
jgi:cytochrome P450